MGKPAGGLTDEMITENGTYSDTHLPTVGSTGMEAGFMLRTVAVLGTRVAYPPGACPFENYP